MKIALVAMSGVRVRTKELAALGVTLPGFVRRGKVIAALPSLGLLTVAGLTPHGHDVAYLEVDDVERLGALPDADLVGISSFTARIDAAYALAARFRARGTPVVLGGLHVSLMPDEALAHADAVVVGGAEGAWPRLVADAEAGRLGRVYAGARSRVFASELYAAPRFDLLAGRSYNRVTVQTSRGCPLHCEFCAASIRITSSYQQKPVAKAIHEIRTALAARREPFLELEQDPHPGEVDAEVLGQVADPEDPPDVVLAVEPDVRGRPGRADETLVLVDPQRARMDADDARRDADHVDRPGGVPVRAPIGHPVRTPRSERRCPRRSRPAGTCHRRSG